MLLTPEARGATRDPLAAETEALIREARRRQRRRRARIVGAVLAVAVGGVASFGAASHERSRPGVGRGAPKRASAPDTARAAAVAPAHVYVVHVASAGRVIVAGSSGIVETSDAGVHWRTITPPTMSRVLFGHIVDVESVGTSRIWLEPVGDERMDFVPFTDDGGARWSVGALPAGAALSGSPLSFWTPATGRALGARNGGTVGVYQTVDGGASWTRVPGATAGPFGGPVAFTSASSGWSWNRSGELFRTEDGGRTWQRVRLPTVPGDELVATEEPRVVGDGVVVVIAHLRGAAGVRRTAFYESGDGGARWHARLAPATGGAASADFAATGSNWFELSGAELFSTADAGTTWQDTGVRTPIGDSIDAIDYLSSSVGWAEAAGPAIGDLYPTYLLRTTDGGRDWSSVRFHP